MTAYPEEIPSQSEKTWMIVGPLDKLQIEALAFHLSKDETDLTSGWLDCRAGSRSTIQVGSPRCHCGSKKE